MTLDAVPVFQTERLVLRCLSSEDTDALFERYSDAGKNSEYMLFGPFTDKRSATALVDWSTKLMISRKGVVWGIVERESGLLIGVLDYRHKDREGGAPHRSEIGYDLSPTHWGKGLMVEAIRPTLGYIFEDHHIIRIEASVDVHNYRSVRVLIKLGFHFEGVLREYGCMQGRFYDAVMLSLLSCEYSQDR